MTDATKSCRCLGRHFRDQLNTRTPTCEYELDIFRYSFFSSENMLSDLPYSYPDDILGQVSEEISLESSSSSPRALSPTDEVNLTPELVFHPVPSNYSFLPAPLTAALQIGSGQHQNLSTVDQADFGCLTMELLRRKSQAKEAVAVLTSAIQKVAPLTLRL